MWDEMREEESGDREGKKIMQKKSLRDILTPLSCWLHSHKPTNQVNSPSLQNSQQLVFGETASSTPQNWVLVGERHIDCWRTGYKARLLWLYTEHNPHIIRWGGNYRQGKIKTHESPGSSMCIVRRRKTQHGRLSKNFVWGDRKTQTGTRLRNHKQDPYRQISPRFIQSVTGYYLLHISVYSVLCYC